MADLTARQDHWTDYLPQSWQHNINTSPMLNALGRALNRRGPDLERAALDTYGTPDQQAEADRQWLLQKAQGPSWLERNPSAADGLNKLGMLANFVGPGVKLPAAAPKPTGIRAYHGSPHDFDRFDISKIGTGEGAQAYGRGLYFAESEGVARTYRDNLAEMHDTGRPGSSMAHILLRQNGGNREAAIQDAIAGQTSFRPGFIKKGDPVGVLRFREAEELLRSEWQPPKGRMYEVRIDADPEQFLDWDKPLSQQPAAARQALQPMVDNITKTANQDALKIFGKLTPLDRNASPTDLNLKQIQSAGYDPADVAQRLREAGIPGIKYLDQMSRSAGQGSRNYVVFDDKLIEILRKYGLLPPVAAGTAAALNQEQPQQ